MGAEKQFLTSREYADRSGLSVTKVTKLLRNGDIKGQKVGGKWMIPDSELDADQPPAAPAGQTAAAAPSDQSFSIAEFSAMTYLTEYGVRNWLKRGILKGLQTEDGEWRIDAASLDAPDIKRLVR